MEQGYVAATMAAIAERAGVALDTVYALVGRKPSLFRELIETAISGQDEAVPAEQREYVKLIQAQPKAARKLEIYAAAVTAIQTRLAPLVALVRDAAAADKQLASLWKEISDRRAANMRLLAADLARTGPSAWGSKRLPT
ncbi:hypothetical protein [Candidatus Dormiibacter inghamiae]|uniref:hypothetical protein n=1 Tax=Candidatus Dormiibacter inghamiae TaxID=3127013 RepID=UPI003312FF17